MKFTPRSKYIQLLTNLIPKPPTDKELEEAFNLLFEDDDIDLDLDFNPKQKIKKSKRLIV